MHKRLIKRARKFELDRSIIGSDPALARDMMAQADKDLLADLEAIMADPNSGLTPERRRHGAELLEAVRWWVQDGHSGEYFETKPGQSSCGYILERYKESR